MNDPLSCHLHAARAAIIAGNTGAALASLEKFGRAAADAAPDAGRRIALEKQIAEMRDLALAAQRGAKSAIDQVRAIVAAARSLQTYDNAGHRQVTSTVAPAPRRF